MHSHHSHSHSHSHGGAYSPEVPTGTGTGIVCHLLCRRTRWPSAVRVLDAYSGGASGSYMADLSHPAGHGGRAMFPSVDSGYAQGQGQGPHGAYVGHYRSL